MMKNVIMPNRLAQAVVEAQGVKGIKIMGLDISSKAVGIALSSPDDISKIRPYHVIRQLENTRKKNTVQRTSMTINTLLDIVLKESPVVGIVVGWPKDLSNHGSGENCAYIKYFVEELGTLLYDSELDLPIAFWDEFSSTQKAKEAFIRQYEEGTVPNKFEPEFVDDIAAKYILESYVNRFFLVHEEEKGRCRRRPHNSRILL